MDAAPNPTEMLQNADAALIIGDPALRIAIEMDALSSRASGKSSEGAVAAMAIRRFAGAGF